MISNILEIGEAFMSLADLFLGVDCILEGLCMLDFFCIFAS